MIPGSTVVVLAKPPVPGRVKTRLCPPLLPSEAAELARAALADTLGAVAATRCARRVVAFDGPREAWIPACFDVVEQSAGTLDARLAAAFAATDGPTVLVGMDTPQVTAALVEDALDRLRGADAVLGPAADGGYWLVGLTRPDAEVFRGVPMSSTRTGRVQLERLEALGYRTSIVATLRDVDRYDDAVAVAAEAPSTEFAAAFGALGARRSEHLST